MITLHRLGHTDEPFQLNPDLIVTIESTPDTVVTLATTAKVVVAESPEAVAAAMRAWRVGVLSEAMRNRRAGAGIGPAGGDSPPASVQDLPRRPGPVTGSHSADPPNRPSPMAGSRTADTSRRPGQVEGSRLPADERGR
jgi:uncharacterized protein YlzI (FlbEa/FlbD family)